MMLSTRTCRLIVILGLTRASLGSDWVTGQIVDTTSGNVQGQESRYRSEVSEYLNIPFAKPPTGDRRWAAPERFEGSDFLDGTVLGNSCPLISAPRPPEESSIESTGLTETGQVILTIQSQRNDTFSEDCLNLNVWTKPQAGDEKKAVLVWIHGGAFTSGSNTNPFHDGALFAEEQDIVVISINYRLNVFGFPGHPDSEKVPYNLGFLDQRLALEWIRDNIENFGGDPEKIVVSGYSAGGASVDYLSYAYADDPIASGFIPESGTATGFGSKSKSDIEKSWYSLSDTLGCGDASADPNEILECLRGKDMNEVIDAVPRFDGVSAIGGAFTPTMDDKLVFSEADYETREPAQRPVLIGTTHDEASLFRVAAALQGQTIGDAIWQGVTQSIFTCPAALRANRSLNNEVPTWWYRYFGDFPNTVLTDDPPSGAWHGSQNLVIFGNSALSGVADTDEEVYIAKWMRGAWAAFAKNPSSGLIDYGWPMYDPSDETLARIGFENKTGGNFVLASEFDSSCRKAVDVTASPTSPAPNEETAPAEEDGDDESTAANHAPLRVFTLAVCLIGAMINTYI